MQHIESLLMQIPSEFMVGDRADDDDVEMSEECRSKPTAHEAMQ